MSAAPSPHRVVAIDGPAASGKSSVAQKIARRLGFAYVNSGTMYRAVTWFILRKEIAPSDSAAVASAIEHSGMECGLRGGQSFIVIDRIDPEPFLRGDEINRAVSQVSSIPRVREMLVAMQRDYATLGDVVMEGRDIGSVVFPDTPYKFYIDASPEVRARRRAAQGHHDEIALRDRADSSRRASPLIIAEDALVIDSSNLTLDGVVGEVIGRLKLQGMHIRD